jgi:hypothetical protein
MRARSVPFGSMFGWIPSTFRLVSGNFGAMSVATLLTLAFGLLLAAPMFVFYFKSPSGLGSPGVPPPQDMGGFWIAYAVTVCAGIVLGPPLLAGWFRLCAAADRGAPVSGTQVLGPYTDGGTWPRLLLFVLLATLMYAAVFAVLFLLFRNAFTGIATMQAQQLAGQAPQPDPALLMQILLMYVIALPTMFVLQFIYMVGLAEVSLRPTSAPAAFGEAAGGVLRNLVKLLVFMFCIFMLAGVLIGVLALVVGLLAAVLAFVSKALLFVVIGLFYLALLLVMYPLMFAGNYYVWKDMLGGDEAAVPAAVAA